VRSDKGEPVRGIGRSVFASVGLAAAIWLATTGRAAAESPSTTARAGLDAAAAAARAWAQDARLVYVENDEDAGGGGRAARWGYLYASTSRGAARGYTVRDGKVRDASDLGFDFDAPPVSDPWIDSDAALAAASREAGDAYCLENAGRLGTMLLIRGAFDLREPDATTWAVIYTAPSAPSLFVVVDARSGKVVRTWRG